MLRKNGRSVMEEKLAQNITVESMKVEDLDDVLKVEASCFKNSWSRYAFLSELTENKLSRYIIVKIGEKLVGYAGMWLVFDEAHVTNIGLLPEYRGFGIGELLMRYLINLALKNGAEKMTLEVRKTNYIAQNLYSKLGFEPSGIRKGYYMDDHEDAIIMWKDLI
jgi:ribosomal-protein-alanine N-acetyltransferase